MAETNRGVEIKITTTVDGAGAAKAKADLQEVKKEAGSAGESVEGIGEAGKGASINLGRMVGLLSTAVGLGLAAKAAIEGWRDAIREADKAAYDLVTSTLKQRDAFNDLVANAKTLEGVEKNLGKLLEQQEKLRGSLVKARIDEDKKVVAGLEEQLAEINRQIEIYPDLAKQAILRKEAEEGIAALYKDQQAALADLSAEIDRASRAQAGLLTKLADADFSKLDDAGKLKALQGKVGDLRDELVGVFGPDAMLASIQNMAENLGALPAKASLAASQSLTELIKVSDQIAAIQAGNAKPAASTGQRAPASAPSAPAFDPRAAWESALAAGDIHLANQIVAAYPGAIGGPAAPPSQPGPATPAAAATAGAAKGANDPATPAAEAAKKAADEIRSAIASLADEIESIGTAATAAAKGLQPAIATATAETAGAITALGQSVGDGFAAMQAALAAAVARQEEINAGIHSQINAIWAQPGLYT